VQEGVGPQAAAGPGVDRRGFLGWASGLGVAGAVTAAYGTFAGFLGRFLYPARPSDRGWLFVCDLPRLKAGDSLVYRTPSGATVNVARTADGGQVSSFIALSSTCPHLGCQVHWEAQSARFFCPCHGGIFEPDGKAIAGPPGKAGQSLAKFPLKVEGGLLFIEVPLAEAELGPGEVLERLAAPPGPGHDPCLYCRGRRA
jgi:nitrite reductase/ring-hydroxylating ferredoxin subunit